MAETHAPAGGDLPPLAGPDRVLVERLPLPPDVPDAVVNKKLLSSALDVSTTTIDAWLVLPEAERIPYVTRGTNGRSYEFRLSVAYAWRMDRDAAEAARAKLAEDSVAQLRLSLLGGSVQDQARAALSPKEQAEALKVEREWIMAAHGRREFIRAADVAEAFEAAFAAIRDGLDAAPDRLARGLSLEGAEVEKAQTILDEILNTAREKVQRLFDTD